MWRVTVKVIIRLICYVIRTWWNMETEIQMLVHIPSYFVYLAVISRNK